MCGGIRHRLPAKLLKPEDGKVALQRGADHFALRPSGTPAHLVEDGREFVVDSDCYRISLHVRHSNTS